MLSYSAVFSFLKLHYPQKRREGGRNRGREKVRRERESGILVSKLLTENINSTKSIKRAFSLRMKKKIQLYSKMEGLNEHFKSYLSQAIS